MKTYEKEGKTFAKLSDVRPWPKNPKTIEDTDLEKLKHQITELGFYKPLVCTPDGEILGGNQRYKALTELGHEEVWVSIVEAWSELDRLKYALSDNLNLGKYKREELNELIQPLSDQQSLFDDYGLDAGEIISLKQFVSEACLTEQELKVKQIKKDLREAGINEETIDVVEQMTKYHKNINQVEDVDIKGCETKERYPLQFWCDTKEDFDRLFNTYSINGTKSLDTNLLIQKTYV